VVLCSCRAVSEREVETAIARGAHSVEAVARACGAGADCGSCHADIGDRIARQCRGRCAREPLFTFAVLPAAAL